MVDFSHYRLNPRAVLQSLERGYRVPDEDWLGVCDRFDPPLLPRVFNEKLHWLLDPKIERRGRPRKNDLTVGDLVGQLRDIERDDVPKDFLRALVERIESGKAYTMRDSDRDYHRRWRRKDRDDIICVLHAEISSQLDETADTYEHPILGPVALPDVRLARHEKVLTVINSLLSGRTDPPVPSESTIASIISRRRHRKKPRRIASHQGI